VHIRSDPFPFRVNHSPDLVPAECFHLGTGMAHSLYANKENAMTNDCQVCEGRGEHGELRERCIACHGEGRPCEACMGLAS
jgi:DnaJ-class molecular chaperone